MYVSYPGPNQRVCNFDGCDGTALPETQECLEHANETSFDEFIDSIRPGDSIAFRGTQIHADRFHRILSALRDERGEIKLGDASFQKSVFLGHISFDTASIQGNCTFSGVTFTKTASFSRIHFSERAIFLGTEFNAPAKFAKITFDKIAFFRGAVFHDAVIFTEIDMQEGVKFAGARFVKTARFTEATFQGRASFKQCQFENATFESCRFKSGLSFSESETTGSFKISAAYVTGSLNASQAKFRADCQFGPVLSTHEINATDSLWEGRTTLSIAAPRMDLSWSRFNDSLRVNARHATLTCEGTRFDTSSILAGAFELRFSNSTGSGVLDEQQIPEGSIRDLPSISTFRGADLSNLTLVDIDLSKCYFIESHNLDKVIMDGDVRFASTPPKRITWKNPIQSRFWTTRKVVVEEQHWRANTDESRDWPMPRRSPSARKPMTAESVANVYRSLRRSQEESKNQPGAADFYYGEMEMRRHAKNLPVSERLIISLYWAISGYGLRASRSILSLVLLTFTTSWLAYSFGFSKNSPTYLQTTVHYLENLVSLRSATLQGVQVNTFGASLNIFLKVVGPVFLGLSVLAVRNRVRR
ncbi:pentapeptide repeat-containing protein [Streptomyces sp. NPDC085942]|uniref:pentapeptide repeat-containing protein n=1 Tax=Streptomyces sp. NPDC085942 TaxID=3365743 RepID=UPI0037D67661